MPEFKSMRQRVEYAYDCLHVDIYYEGNYLYTIYNNTTDEEFSNLTEEQMDQILEKINFDCYAFG